MKYKPKNELTEQQLKELSEDSFFEYLDSKSEYLNQNKVPLDQYHTKKYAAASLGGNMSTKQLREAKKIGKEGEIIKANKIKEAANSIEVKKPELYVKNHKTNRSQWFE